MSKQLPEITESTKFNFITSIWIVPLIALIIAGWLAYQYFEDRGPEIEIVFPVNEGLIAGQSVLKFKNVPIGKVTKIHVEDNTDGVIITVRMSSKRSKLFLTEKAKFWIVKPEVGLSGISGLDTLISGTYINAYSEKGGKRFKQRYVGLTQAYWDTKDGKYFHLISANGESISAGMPVYYKNIKAGHVEYVYLSLNKKSIETIIFIDKQYTSLVKSYSKFWIKSTFNVDFTKGNLDVNIAPVNILLQGGIVFSSSDRDDNDSVDSDKIFPIYKNETQAKSHVIGSVTKSLEKFILHTSVSTANLKEYSPVRFYDFDIGWVEEIAINYDIKTHKMLSKITIALDTSVFVDEEEQNRTGLENLYTAVTEGMRAKLEALDPISGMLYVDLTFDHNEGNASIIKHGTYAEIPVVKHYSAGIMNSMTKILNKINDLPLDKLVHSLDKVINETSVPIANANEMLIELKKSAKHLSEMTSKKTFTAMPDDISKALKELTHTIKTTQKVVKGYDSNSILSRQLSHTLKILTKTSKEMEVFLRMLNRKPNSLIFGDN